MNWTLKAAALGAGLLDVSAIAGWRLDHRWTLRRR